MSLDNDRGRPGGGGLDVELLAGGRDTAILRRAGDSPPRLATAVATGIVVTARSGRTRLLIVVHWPHCQDWHAHTSRAPLTSAVKTAACRRGKYVVVVRQPLGVVA